MVVTFPAHWITRCGECDDRDPFRVWTSSMSADLRHVLGGVQLAFPLPPVLAVDPVGDQIEEVVRVGPRLLLPFVAGRRTGIAPAVSAGRRVPRPGLRSGRRNAGTEAASRVLPSTTPGSS